MFSSFDYFDLQSHDAKLWSHLKTKRHGKNVVVSDQCAIWIHEVYTDDNKEVTIQCTVLPSILLRTPVENKQAHADLYEMYVTTILEKTEDGTPNVVDEMFQSYVQKLRDDATDTTQFIVIPVVIVGDGGHQCVLVLRRDKPPFWFDPNGRWNMVNEKLSLTSKRHVSYLLTALLKRMQGVNDTHVNKFLTEIPEHKRIVDGRFTWPPNTTVNIQDDITQIQGQNENNWFLPGKGKTNYMNEDEGICFTTSVVFILGLVCQKDPDSYLTHQWWDTFYKKLLTRLPKEKNTKFRKRFIDFICTMLHRSIMYHLYRVIHDGEIPVDADITYFDYDKCKRVYEESAPTGDENEEQMKDAAKKIADSCMLSELRVHWSMYGDTIHMEIDPQKYTDVIPDIVKVFGTNGGLQTNLPRQNVRTKLESIASEHGYVLTIME